MRSIFVLVDLDFAPRLVFHGQATHDSTTSFLVSFLMNCSSRSTAGCTFGVAVGHIAPLSTNEDLGTGVLLCGKSGHGRLRVGLQAFHTLLRGGILAFEWGGGGLNSLLDPRKCTFNLGARGGLTRAKKLGHPLQTIIGQLNDPHSAISINNAQHIVDNTWTNWGEWNIRERSPVIHHQVCELQALKTTRPTILSKPVRQRGRLGKAFIPFTFLGGTGAVGGGAKGSNTE